MKKIWYDKNKVKKRADRIIKLADIRLIFKDLQIRFIEKGYGDLWFQCRTPGHKDRDASAHICADRVSPNHGLWRCFGCESKGTIIDLVRDTTQATFWETLLWLEQRLGEEPICVTVTQFPMVVSLPKYYEFYTKKSDWDDYYLSYIEERKIRWDQVIKHKIGYCHRGKYRKRIIIPVRLNGMLKTWIGRSVDKKFQRIQTAKGGTVGLFGSEFAKPSLGPAILVEGWADALKIERMGYPNAMALQTNQIHEEQFQFIEKFDSMIVIPDGDDGGNRLIDSLGVYINRIPIYVGHLPRGKDPDDMNEIELENVIENSYEWMPIKQEREIEYLF